MQYRFPMVVICLIITATENETIFALSVKAQIDARSERPKSTNFRLTQGQSTLKFTLKGLSFQALCNSFCLGQTLPSLYLDPFTAKDLEPFLLVRGEETTVGR